MATSTLVTIEQYLSTDYRPDVEYIDGELWDKNVLLRRGDPMVQWAHSRLQVMIGSWFDQHEDEWSILSGVEARTRVSASRVRLPDVVVVAAGPYPETLVEPPLIVVEVLSPDDTYAEIERRARDYREMGVMNIWLIDPDTRTARVCSRDAWTETLRFTVEGSPIYLDVAALFARLDKYFPAPKP